MPLQSLALLVSGALLVGLELLFPTLTKRLGRRSLHFLVLVASAYFGASLFALTMRALDWASLRTPAEMFAFAAGLLASAALTGRAASRFALQRVAR